MPDGPSVGIIVTSYNYGRFLRQAIDSALAQTYPWTTVTVVDDGSTDESRAIIAAYGDRIRRVLKANGGQASAINAGLAVTPGRLVILLDADDVLFPETAARVVAAWRPGVAKVQYRLQVIDTCGVPAPVWLPDARVPMPTGDLAPIVLTRFVYPSPPTSGNAYDREALSRLCPVPEAAWRITADAYFATGMAFLGSVVSIGEPVYLTVALSRPARVTTVTDAPSGYDDPGYEVKEAGRRRVPWLAPLEPGVYAVKVEATTGAASRRTEPVEIRVEAPPEPPAADEAEAAAPEGGGPSWPLVALALALIGAAALATVASTIRR
jgi:hypothetical protein